MWWLLAACGSCLLFSTVVSGTFVPLQNPNGVEYVFVRPQTATLLIVWLPCVFALATAFLAVRAVARSQSPEHLAEAESGRWLAPIAGIGAVALGILPALPGVGERGAVISYFLYDLRWWWTIVLVALTCARTDRLVGAPLARIVRRIGGWSSAARLLLLDSMLFVGVVSWAITTSAIRFDSTLNGDEPKYVRYCEAWYQGQGLDISSLALVRDEPLDAPPAMLQNAVRLVRAIPQDVGALVQDLRAFARDPSAFQWNRARSYNGFVTGIRGGTYQIHEPGMSAVLFPGYFVDRYLLNVDSSADGKWPADLTMTNLMMLVTYGICAVVLFRLLRNVLGSESLGWMWAAVAMLTLPTTAFAFQLYPELPALLIILAVSNELLFSDRSRSLAAAAVAGAATGVLAWFHVRFLLICLCLAAVAYFKRSVRARWAFLAPFGFFIFSVLAFDYHVTGSWWPTALWEADGLGVTFNSIGFVLNFVGYGLDRQFGLVPHSLLLIGALPGLLVLARQSRGQAAFVAAVVLALVAPAAGHLLNASGTTPDRLVAAVVPLLIWPVAVLVKRFWAFAPVRIATVMLGVLSLDAALAYNRHHSKSFGLMRDASLSGWKPNLAFPIIRGEVWSTSHANFVLFLCVAVLIVGLALLAFLRASPPASVARVSGRHALLVSALTIAVLIGGFSAATAANEDWTHSNYLLADNPARAAAARALMIMDRCLCFSSTHGHIDWTRLQPNSARGALVGVYTADLRLNLHIVVEGDGKVPAFGRMRIDFGDGDETPWDGIITDRQVGHTYRQAGSYPLKVWFQLPTQVAVRLYKETVEVHSSQ